METLQSHILHLYFLVRPGLSRHRQRPAPGPEPIRTRLQRALRLKLLANDACDIIGGRRLHPTRTVVGGFTMLPEKEQTRRPSATGYRHPCPILLATAELFKTFTIPDFSRETEFVSLKGAESYPFIGGDLVSTDGVVKRKAEYRQMTNEYCVDGSTSKWSSLSRKSFAVGALARLEQQLRPSAPAARELSENRWA